MTGFPNQGRVKFQDEREMFDFVTGGGSAGAAAIGLGGGGMFRRNAAAVSLVNDTSNQSVFGVGKGQFTVEAGKSYQFEGNIQLNNGSSSHTTLFGFTLVGATLANVRTFVTSTNGADDTPAAATLVNLEVATPSAVNAAATGVETELVVSGTFDCTVGGTVQPVVAFGTAPGGTNTVEVGSWFKLSALGPTTVERFGAVT